MLKKNLFVFFSAIFLILSACGPADTPAPDETPGDTGAAPEAEEVTELVMGFVPSQDADKIADTVEPLAERLSEILDVDIRAQVLVDYTGLVEGMRTQHIDIGFLPPFGFVQAEERAGVEVILKAIRHGSDTYRAQFNVLADSEIDSVEDIVNTPGLVWAYADTTSTAGFLFPASYLMDQGVDNLDTHFTQMVVGGHDNALIALMDGQAEVATTFEDARERIEGDHPTVMEDVKVVGYTDPIPNDTISLRSGMSEEWRDKIKEAFLGFNDDPEMMEVMQQVYNWTGIAEASSEDYQVVRDTFERFREQLE